MLFVDLKAMPYDRPDGEGGLVHATGLALVCEDGYLMNLFENDGIEPGEDDEVISEAEFYGNDEDDW